MKKKMNLPPEVREQFRKAGAKGGRKATVPHKTEGYCRCAECRKSRGEWGPQKKGMEALAEVLTDTEFMEDADFDNGA